MRSFPVTAISPRPFESRPGFQAQRRKRRLMFHVERALRKRVGAIANLAESPPALFGSAGRECRIPQIRQAPRGA
jgi:hypothetical protein